MAEEIKPEVISKTQETLGKFIKKPVLTEKLLTKPPFRFLHDICTACMRETGFFEGVLTPFDVKVENIKDKDGKIAFLQKVIAAVEAANGIKLSIKPNKVVAGHEPTHTNEFLQALGKALEKQVAKNGNGAKPPQPTKTKTRTVKKSEKQDAPEKKKLNSSRQAKTTNEGGPHDDVKKKQSAEKISVPSEKETKKKASLTSIPDSEQVSGPAKEEAKAGEGEKPQRRRERVKLKNSPSLDSSDASSEGKASRAKDKPVEPTEEPEVKRPPSAKPGHKKSIAEAAEPAVSPPPPPPPKETEAPEPPKPEPPPPRIPSEAIPKRPESSFMRMNKPPSTSTVDPNYSTKDSDAVEEPSPISRPLTSIRPTTGRPASARPAAPRIRDRGEISVHEDIVKPSPGNVLIITDKQDENEAEEDENVVTIEAANEVVDELDVGGERLDLSKDQGARTGEHGLLVEQILETQKELEQVIDSKLSGKTEIEWKSNRNRESTDREIKKLRLAIQTLTRSANPLGKLLDFLQEDVDIMQKELTNWREMNADLDVQIAQERNLTEQSVEPMKVHLKELQQMIDQQMEQMTVVKANILRNDQKIHKLLTEMK